METTTAGSLPFLNIEISINDGKFDTKVYRKPTNTGILMNFNSNAPMKWKKALIKYMLLRAYKLSSSFEFFQAEVEKIRGMQGWDWTYTHIYGRICKNIPAYTHV